MTTLTDFSPEDLAVLNRTPTAVAMAAAYAGQDGALSLVREMRAGLTAAREAVRGAKSAAEVFRSGVMVKYA